MLPNPPIVFNEEKHTYRNIYNKHYYVSGTTFVHGFETPFDKEKAALAAAEKSGKTVKEVIAAWEEKGRQACDFGTMIHAVMEHYIKGEKYDEQYKRMYTSFQDICGADMQYADAVHSELMLWNDEFEVAGTADLIIDHPNGEFTVGDFKTNEKLEYASKFGTRFLDPISHLTQCEHSRYSLQLSLYAYFYSLLTGRKCRGLYLMWLNRNTKKWRQIPCNYLMYEIMMMLEYRKAELLKKSA